MAEETIRNNGGSPTESPMEHVLLFSSYTPTRTERLKMCCKPTYHIRKLKNKGAIIVLIRNFLVNSFFFYMISDTSTEHDERFYMYITWGLTLPLIGWLSDVRLGRHKVISWSICLAWVAFVSVTIVSDLETTVQLNKIGYVHAVKLVLLILASMGFGGHQANVVHYGLDQLQDSSTDEITSFISWYVWSSMSGAIVVVYTQTCIPEEYLIFSKVVVCLFLSLALILSIFSEHMLIKEPVTQNPFKLVYNVVKYAIKNKHPRCRSAFTYCEDELPSRIDFGKNKYGGPFTTEQVEDVKTFFRILPGVFLYCTLPSIVITVDQLVGHIQNITDTHIPKQPTSECHLKVLFYNNIMYYVIIVLLPFYEFAIYPVFRRHFSWVKSHYKFLLGVLLQIGRVLALMAIVLKARHTHFELHGYNSTVQCILFEGSHGALSDTFASKWMLVPSVLRTLSVLTLSIGGAEFICAQLPYSMRGLTFGSVYGSVSVYVLIGYGIRQVFTRETTIWGTGIISCGFWYLLFNLIVLGINGVLLALLAWFYKLRKREDVLPNEQIFAERYYSKYSQIT